MRRDRSADKSPTLGSEFSSHRREYKSLVGEVKPSEDLTSHGQLKLVFEERRPSIASNCSSSSPPAPAQGTSPAPGSALSTFSHIASRSPSRPFTENDPFLFIKKEHTQQNPNKCVSPLSSTNGWSKKYNSTMYSKKNEPELSSVDYASNTVPPQITSNHNSQSHSPMPIGNEPLAQLLITLKDQNKSLIREIEDLRIKLEDAEGKFVFLYI